MISAVVSLSNVVFIVSMVRDEMFFSSLLLLVFRIVPSGLHKDKDSSLSEYLRAFWKSMIFSCFIEMARSFAKTSRLISTVLLSLIRDLLNWVLKPCTFTLLIGSLNGVLLLHNLFSTKSWCRCSLTIADDKRNSSASEDSATPELKFTSWSLWVNVIFWYHTTDSLDKILGNLRRSCWFVCSWITIQSTHLQSFSISCLFRSIQAPF